MLHVLQYFTGTSIAATADVANLTITQSSVGGPIAKGSSEGSGTGIEWRLRGTIPGSTTDACTNDDIQMQKTYANRIGIAGEMLCHSQGAE